ncbi:hypothetical protein ASPWEDRAFT_116856 [Aspergillus wentii DTO 134E9]|uniref:C2H2-type domain-containing protein n=1 Tax=Aspergillus wentii DTO 134E9 TaxID=1073089 RepID=A0A1L9RAR4_ASPWE|nr:uncharacterized protein ASPWEDRAFT_116856 [Aspergillus wentii DTO 134E9]OJJ32026.1 hypothetical protein ASPWEDRAFT_116856 [Aspergillus wentii DTO 134E9]
MLAVDPSRQHPSYFEPLTMDSAVVDPFAYHVDHLNYNSSRVPHYYDTPGLYTESASDIKAPGFPSMPVTPPSIPISQSADPHMSGLSTGPSIASASSSAVGSPYSGTIHAFQDNWVHTSNGMGHPGAVMDEFFPNDYAAGTLDAEGAYQKDQEEFVALSLIEPMQNQTHLSPPTFSYPEQSNYMGFLPQPSQTPEASPVPMPESYPAEQPSLEQPREVSVSSPAPAAVRESSVLSTHSRRSPHSPAASSAVSNDEQKGQGFCPIAECGKFFKDLKTHMVTHRSERPQKCPRTDCSFHTKGFARKYDKNRHIFTHYKGTLVCCFCPGSGTPAEKTFNRLDIFRRHLTAVHNAEQTPSNGRKRSPNGSTKKSTVQSSQATGKCTTCFVTFKNAQDFHDHLDDCVFRYVQLQQPSEAINQQRLAEVASDEEVKKTLEKHNLPDTAGSVDQFYDEDDENNDDDLNDPTILSNRSGKGSLKSTKGKPNATFRPIKGNNNAISKKGKALPTASKRRSNRDHYPQSWGCPRASMKIKKRVLCVFDGKRRLCKDDMMLDNEFEVRVKLPGGAGDGTAREAYVTDLDVETMKRAEGIFSATDEERGPWLDRSSNQLIGRPAVPLPNISPDIDELMS